MLEDEEENINNKKINLIDTNEDCIILDLNNKKEKKSLIDLDKQSLVKFGYDSDLVNTIYKNAFPVNINEALDYLYKNDNNEFTHVFISNSKGLCAICEKDKLSHSTNDFYDIEKDTILSKLESPHLNYYQNSNLNINCEICEEEISYFELRKIKTSCNHKFCSDCWKEYLKEKINVGKVYKIKCMNHNCNHVLEEKFIKSIIGTDEELLKKYEKFLEQKKLLNSKKKIKFCPFPDCDGYAEKKGSKYVECNFGHKFCFVCGQKPHGWKGCSTMIDKGFEEWKSHNLVKRCPYCKYYTEKSDGCNHMTCSQCNFQWCWICEKECVVGHYLFGTCKGLHFSNTDTKKDAKNLLCDNCGFFCCFSWIIMKILFLLAYLIVSPYFYLYILINKNENDDDDYYKSNNNKISYFTKGLFFINFIPFFICYEVLIICYITVFSIPAIIIWPYYRFLRYIFFGQIFGKLFAVGDGEP